MVGELQKRIGITPYKYRQGDNALIFDNSAISKADVYNFVEEMRQEFPFVVDSEAVKQFEQRHARDEPVYKVFKWFEKWLAETEK